MNCNGVFKILICNLNLFLIVKRMCFYFLESFFEKIILTFVKIFRLIIMWQIMKTMLSSNFKIFIYILFL